MMLVRQEGLQKVLVRVVSIEKELARLMVFKCGHSGPALR